MDLQPRQEDKRTTFNFCGPSAISIVTGKPMEEIHQLIVEHRKNNHREHWGINPLKIKATHLTEIHAVVKTITGHNWNYVELDDVGFWMETYDGKSIWMNKCPTLTQFAKDHAEEGVAYILRHRGHIFAFMDGMVMENCDPEPKPIKGSTIGGKMASRIRITHYLKPSKR